MGNRIAQRLSRRIKSANLGERTEVALIKAGVGSGNAIQMMDMFPAEEAATTSKGDCR